MNTKELKDKMREHFTQNGNPLGEIALYRAFNKNISIQLKLILNELEKEFRKDNNE